MLLADLAVQARYSKAYGNANETKFKAEAVKETIVAVIQKQSEAYKEMMDSLEFEKEQVIEYMKADMIKNYETSRMAIKLDL